MRRDLAAATEKNRELLAVLLKSTAKVFRLGNRRSCLPSQTFPRLKSVAERIGVTRIGNTTGLDRIGIPVVSVCRPQSRSLAVYQGKGATLEAAKVSGLMESVERYHAESIGRPELVVAYDALKKVAPVIDPDRLAWRDGRHFRASARRGWMQGVNLVDRQPVWVPYDVIQLDYLSSSSPDGYFSFASTGLAAGNSPAEAILHGLCEVIERDSTTLWRLRPATLQDTTRIDLSTVDDPLCRDLIARIEAAGLAVAIWETTSDVGVASFVCRIGETRDLPPSPHEMLDAAGCHPAREVALARAILEAVQGRATVISGARDDLFQRFYEDNDRGALASLRHNLLNGQARRPFGAASSFDGHHIEDDIAHVIARLAAAGIDLAIVVDLTRDDIGIPVVKVLIPQLEDGELSEDYVPRTRALRAYGGIA